MLCITTPQLQWLISSQGLFLVVMSVVGEPQHAGLMAEEGQAGGHTQWLVKMLLQDEI